MSELVSNGVQIYQFPLDDETVAKVNTTMNVRKRKLSSAVLPGDTQRAGGLCCRDQAAARVV